MSTLTISSSISPGRDKATPRDPPALAQNKQSNRSAPVTWTHHTWIANGFPSSERSQTSRPFGLDLPFPQSRSGLRGGDSVSLTSHANQFLRCGNSGTNNWALPAGTPQLLRHARVPPPGAQPREQQNQL